MAKKSVKPPARASDDVNKLVGHRVRQLRMQIGLSQQQIAEELGVSFQQVQKYEKGRNRLSASRLIELAHVLNTTPHDLLGYDASVLDKEPPLNSFNVEAYKLVHSFMELPETLLAPIRILIDSLIETHRGVEKKKD
jgi:transcriptional regulator with XRE-family HTH domain